ncbi:hypothetical protein ZIOFF_016593 [Zingiber officinale]|uniref:Malectin-like domain-containing protein n=1 Tax=Zingiber officinale TaxID=94328 RepID=A0A8J5HK53_ZINOF|nr:hypothetical protein ZIOFF_016593 [Zingiber officinale]
MTWRGLFLTSYVSDADFIDTGINHNISVAYMDDFKSPRFRTLRALPNGTRNYYTIRSPAVARGSKYLLRAWFFYGNYDGLDSQPLAFDLHLGFNYWDRVNVITTDSLYWTETITVATAEYSSVLVSVLGEHWHGDAVHLRDRLAAIEGQSLPDGKRVADYPDDPIDRVWPPWRSSEGNWNDVSTNSTVRNLPQDSFEVPSVVMQTAVAPINSSSIVLAWDPIPGYVNQFFPILHISEFFNLSGTNQSRQFNIYVNRFQWLGDIMTPLYLYSDSVYDVVPLPSSPTYIISLEALSNSTLPPILNAFELYTTMSNTSVPSDTGDGMYPLSFLCAFCPLSQLQCNREEYDAHQLLDGMFLKGLRQSGHGKRSSNSNSHLHNIDAMTAIKERYRIQRNWMGDPCSPSAFVWDGLTCDYSLSNSPRVTALSLSSSGLTGEITKSFASLSALQNLDLSYNNLTGSIPDDLANLSSLKLLDLTGNQLNGSIPSNLLEMAQNGLLTLRFVLRLSLGLFIFL